MAIELAPLTEATWPDVERIYAAGIATGNATFESQTPDWQRFGSSRLLEHAFVALDGGAVVGWVAASPVSSRPVYQGVIEHSVYVDPAAAGRGVGRALVEALIASTETAGIWMIQSSIFPENAASLALHDGLGFRRVGRRERIALMSSGPWAGKWRDTVLVERRSAVAGS